MFIKFILIGVIHKLREQDFGCFWPLPSPFTTMTWTFLLKFFTPALLLAVHVVCEWLLLRISFYPKGATSPSAPPSPSSVPRSSLRRTSLTTMSLSNLAASSPSQFAVTLSTSLEIPFKINIETVQFQTEHLALKLGLQIALFHGGRLLCPLKTIMLKAQCSENPKN